MRGDEDGIAHKSTVPCERQLELRQLELERQRLPV